MNTSNLNFQVPLEREANKRFRAALLQKAENDLELQAVIREKCRIDDEFFFNVFAWTFDPRLAEPVVPFILYPKQVKLVHWLNYLLAKSRTEKVNGIIDKPRDVGATFTVMTWILKKFLFEEFSARVGSRKEDYVDKRGEQDTLFFKFDFTLERLPKWLIKEPTERASMILTNGTNNISGESANPNFGRGGRKTISVFDEHAFWEYARSSWESAGESTNFRLSMSTPPETGRDSHFYKLLTGQMGTVEKFEFDWTDVPTRNQEWMIKQRETKSEEELAREVLKSYEGTLEGKVYATDFRLAKMSTVDYKPHLPLFVHWDFGLDTVAMGWMQKDMETNKLYLIDSYSNSNKAIDFYVPFVTGVIQSGVQNGQVIHEYTDYERTLIERHANWNKTITHFGDPDVNKRSIQNGESTKDVLERYGIYVQSTSWAGRTWQDIKEKTKLSFRRLEINEARNEIFISAMRNAKYPKKREGSQSTTEPIKPVHDWTSHFRSSYEYFIDNEPESEEFAHVSQRNTWSVYIPD